MSPAAPAAPAFAPASEVGAGARASALGGVRVLVVEDEPMIALNLEEALEDAGASVSVVRGVATALSALDGDGDGFDVALLDVNLGRGETCEPIAMRLRELGVPFVLHSGDLDRRGELIASLDAPLVPKPAADEAIVAGLTRAMG